MVGGDHQQVALPHPRQEISQKTVELRSGGSVACHIAAVAVEHIKVYQIHEGKAFKIPGLQSLGKGDAVGVAGGLKEDQNVLDIVISDKIVQADYDTSPIDGDDGIGLVFEADEKLKETCIEAAKKAKITYHVGTIASQDIFMARKEDYDRLMTKFADSACSEMEGGAIGQIAHVFNVPVLIVRSLSDVVDHHDNPMEFTTYAQIASKQAATLIKEMMRS